MRLLCILVFLYSGSAMAKAPDFLRWQAARYTIKLDTEPRLDFYKMILYNRSYGLAKCLVENAGASNKIEECDAKFLQTFGRFYKKLEAGVPAVKVTSCYPAARLASEEAKFPPYEFLKGHDVFLLDLDKFTGCISKS